MRRALVLIVAVTVSASSSIGAQPAPVHRASPAPETFVHESWTVQDGLPVNSITAVLQSRDGYLWVATYDGLARFDGVRFTVFNSANSPGLPSNRILTFREARDGSLWLRTEQRQLVRYHDGTFTPFGPERGVRHPILTVYEDSVGSIWVGTEHGFGYIRGEAFVPVAAGTVRTGVNAFVRRADGTIWVGTDSGDVFRVVGDTATALRVPGIVTTLYEDPRRTLWIGSSKGAWRYRESLDRVLTDEYTWGMSASPRTGETWLLTNNRVYRIGPGAATAVLNRAPIPFTDEAPVADHSGNMLYSSGAELHREGSRIYSLLSGTDGVSLTQRTISAMTFDREGSLWLGTYGNGLHRLKPAPFTVYSEAEGLSSRNVYSVFEDRTGAMWIGTLGGETNRLDRGRVTRLPNAAGFPVSALAMMQDRDGQLWLGSADGRGLRTCAPPFVRCVSPAGDPIRSGTVFAIHQDSSGAIWFGTSNGLFRRAGETWTRLEESAGAPSFPVRAFEETRDGALWMATNGGGLTRYARGRLTRVSTADGLPIDLVRSLYQDADGWLWVGTEGRGLARLDPREWGDGQRGGRIVSYRTTDGLFDEVIHRILEDDYGRLWMSSNRGIFSVDRQELNAFASGTVARIHSTGYTERDGLRNREANGGSQPAGIKSRDGRLWFPTQDGVAVVDPSKIRRNTVLPNVVIEQIRAGGATIQPSHDELALGTHQRDLEVDYTALSFVAPANMRFRYRLEPYDRTWVEAGNRRTAFYTRVPPGDYQFHVIATNNDGVWNDTGATLRLHLDPRFYETRAFRALLVLSAIMVLALGVAWRVRRLRARTIELGHLVDERTTELRAREAQLAIQNAQLEAQAVQLQNLDRTKSRFFANVSHELRTPLTLILGPLRDLTDERHGKLPAVLQRQVQMMTRNAQRLLRLVNQVLDVAKLESGSLTLVTKPRDLIELSRAITLSFTPLAERRDVRLQFIADASPVVARVDAEQLEKVLANLLSNAFKFTEPGGEVEVSVRHGGGDAVIAVRDTGIGIAPDQVGHVFDRFYQADSSSTRRHEGTGIGLSLAKELVELHGGTVSVESTLGVGSTFRVRLPLDTTSRPEPFALEPVRLARTDESPVPARGDASENGEQPDRTTVLVVDDNADVRTYVRSVLDSSYRVIEASDGEQGLALAKDALPDLVVADVMMPKMDGFALARGLRDDPNTDCIPVILLTARADVSAEIEGLGTGADDYISKPFHAGVLQARISALLANRQRLRDRFRQEGLPPTEPVAAPVAKRSELAERLRPIIEANLTEPDFNPEALADVAGLSYQQLYRRLAADLEMTPSQLIRTVRVERAAQLLRDGAGTVTEVAYSVGFNSLSHFHRSFRERFGTTPGRESGIGNRRPKSDPT